MVNTIQMSIILTAAVCGSDEDIPIKLQRTVQSSESLEDIHDSQGGEGQEDGQVDLHHHLHKIVRECYHDLTETTEETL